MSCRVFGRLTSPGRRMSWNSRPELFGSPNWRSMDSDGFNGARNVEGRRSCQRGRKRDPRSRPRSHGEGVPTSSVGYRLPVMMFACLPTIPRNLTLDRQTEYLQNNALAQNPIAEAVLAVAGEVRLPGWYLGAGAGAQTVWNLQHGFAAADGIKDYDLVYFDPDDLTAESEQRIEQQVAARLRGIGTVVDGHTEARVHLWYEARFGRRLDPPLDRGGDLYLADDGVEGGGPSGQPRLRRVRPVRLIRPACHGGPPEQGKAIPADLRGEGGPLADELAEAASHPVVTGAGAGDA